jgi:uncharacterized protein with GYD domain
MAKYVILVNWTDQGVKTAADTVSRSEQVREMGSELGATIETILWTMGRYDIVVVIDSPDNATAARFAAKVSALGNVRTETLPAFTADEVAAIVG